MRTGWRRAGPRGLVAAMVALVGLLPVLLPPARSGAQVTAPAEAACAVAQEVDVPATMRDGTVLYADVYRPTAPGSYPVLLLRLPYNKQVAQTNVYARPEFYAAHCYVVVVQDVRGQYRSEGTFYPFLHEAEDGYDTVEWAAVLPGANGKVGMYGFSYPGATQWLAATQAPPHLVAIAPGMTGSDYYDGWSYQDGAWNLAFEESWPITTIARSAAMRLPDPSIAEGIAAAVPELPRWYEYLPLRDFPPLRPADPRVAPYFYDWIAHPSDDDYWQRWSIRPRYAQIAVPALNFDAWYNIFLRGAVENYRSMRERGGSEAARAGQRLVVGPWVHLPWQRQVGELDFGPEADNPIDALQLRWFDYWLKGIDNGALQPRVRVFVMGANRWRDADDWPIPGTAFTDYYLHSGGAANTALDDGWLSTTPPEPAEVATDRYRYDPNDPVPSVGGHSCCTVEVAPIGPRDQQAVESRQDVLVYSTPPLPAPVEVTGPLTVTLYAATSAVDTDFTAKLVDVYPDGRAINLGDGIQRARYRRSLTTPELVTPGAVEEYTIALWPTSNLFGAGHRIRLEISSSNFPAHDRNPNTGHPFGQDAELRPADQTIYHDAARPSRLTLPIVPTPLP